MTHKKIIPKKFITFFSVFSVLFNKLSFSYFKHSSHFWVIWHCLLFRPGIKLKIINFSKNPLYSVFNPISSKCFIKCTIFSLLWWHRSIDSWPPKHNNNKCGILCTIFETKLMMMIKDTFFTTTSILVVKYVMWWTKRGKPSKKTYVFLCLPKKNFTKPQRNAA